MDGISSERFADTDGAVADIAWARGGDDSAFTRLVESLQELVAHPLLIH